MSKITMRELLEAGVHFGHQTRRWNPKMKPYIFGARNGIYIIDLQKTVGLFNTAYDFIANVAASGKSILFVGTKKQAKESIYEEAVRAEQYYVHNRWLGGMLTNFQTIKKSIDRLHYLNEIEENGNINLFPKKERVIMGKERTKLDTNIGGIAEMTSMPGALFVVDPKNEAIAINEARRLRIPVVGLVDTNCDPDDVDFIIPGNDDAIRSVRLITGKIAEACLEGRARWEEKRQAQADKAGNDGKAAKSVDTLAPAEEGPIVEVIKRTAAPMDFEASAEPEAAETGNGDIE